MRAIFSRVRDSYTVSLLSDPLLRLVEGVLQHTSKDSTGEREVYYSVVSHSGFSSVSSSSSSLTISYALVTWLLGVLEQHVSQGGGFQTVRCV